MLPHPRLLLISACLLAQDTPPLRVTTTLVQVDAVVTDRQGRHITDLNKDDFEIFEDGKRRTIAHVSYVRTGAASAVQAPAQTPRDAAPVGAVRRENVRRTIALLVDDLKMSFEGLNHTRTALRKFVNEQMAEGDLVAVLSTSGGMSAFQQFTADRRVLHAGIDRLRFLLGGGGQGGAMKAMGGAGTDNDPLEVSQIANRRFAVGTLGTMRYVIEGMREMPGRKSLVLFSDGFAMRPVNRKQIAPVNVGDVRKVSDRANLSAVVVYAIDTRGLPYFGLQAQDDVQGLESKEVRDALEDREGKFRDEQEGLQFLAAETGGLAEFGNNDINKGLLRMLGDQSGYYLLAFQPDEESASRIKREGKYHRLQVKVNRPGLRVRNRNAFLQTSEDREEPQRTPRERLMGALQSPFTGAGVPVRMTPMFASDDKGGLSLRALLHIGGDALSFGPAGADGHRAAKVRILAVTDGENASVMTEDTYTVRAQEESMGRLRQGGFVYALEQKVKKPGGYQMRIAVLDEVSGSTGSAHHFIEAPDLRKGRLAMSGILMCDCDSRQAEAPSQASQLSPAIRVFGYDRPFSYEVTLYNVPVDAKTGKADVALRPRLIRGDRVVWEGEPLPVHYKRGDDPRRLITGSSLTLGRKTAPGAYLLELQAIHAGEPGISQSIDFELR